MDPDLDPLFVWRVEFGPDSELVFHDSQIHNPHPGFLLGSRKWVNCWRIRNPGEERQQLIGVRPSVPFKLLADPQPW